MTPDIMKQESINIATSCAPSYRVQATYVEPRLKIIALDNDISLAMESEPPYGPEELGQNTMSPFLKNTQNQI